MDKNNTSGRYQNSGPETAFRAEPLGIYAITASAPVNVDFQTGEILDAPADPKRHRAERFALKSIVNRLLPTSRTSKCCRWRVPKQALQIHRQQPRTAQRSQN